VGHEPLLKGIWRVAHRADPYRRTAQQVPPRLRYTSIRTLEAAWRSVARMPLPRPPNGRAGSAAARSDPSPGLL